MSVQRRMHGMLGLASVLAAGAMLSHLAVSPAVLPEPQHEDSDGVDHPFASSISDAGAEGDRQYLLQVDVVRHDALASSAAILLTFVCLVFISRADGTAVARLIGQDRTHRAFWSWLWRSVLFATGLQRYSWCPERARANEGFAP